MNKEFLVVWEDLRRRSDLSIGHDIYGAHVNSWGAVMEPVGFLITNPDEGGDHRYPSIQVGQGGVYLVAYSTGNGVYVRAVPTGTTGTPPASSEAQIDATASLPCVQCTYTAIANNVYSGGAYSWYVAWIDGTSLRGKQFTFTYSSPNLTASAGLAPGLMATGALSVALAGSTPHTGAPGTNFLLVTGYGTTVSGRVIDQTGMILTGPFTLFSNAISSAVDFYGNTGTWLVAADEPVGGSDFDIQARQVSTTGVAYNVYLLASGSSIQSSPAVAGYGPSGQQALVTWQEGALAPPGTVKAIRVTTNSSHDVVPVGSVATIGGVVNTGLGPIAAHYDDFADDYLIAWNDFRANPSDFVFGDIYGARYSSSGSLLDPVDGFLISKSATKQETPAVATCGSTYLVAWSETGPDIYNANIYGSILSSTGTVLHSHIAISTASASQTKPAIACNGTDYFVVWEDSRNGNFDVYGTAVAQNGTVANPSGLGIVTTTQYQRDPAITFLNGRYWVVWETGFIQGASISASNVVTLLGNVSSTRTSKHPDIATDGAKLFVVFEVGNAIGGTMVTGGVPGATFAVDTSAGAKRYPKVAWDGLAYYQVVYEDDALLSTHGTDVTARRVTPSATVSAAVSVASSSDNELGPHLAFRTGSALEVAYWRGTTSTPFEYDVIGQSLLGGALFGASYAIANATPVREMSPAIACTGKPSCLVGYRWFDADDVTAQSDRIRARVIDYP